MAMKTKYRTKQREELLEYLRSLNGEHITAALIAEHFKERGSGIGKATIYRQLEQMVEEGLVYKYVVDANSPACFEYVPEESHGHREVCFHCKCEKCGKLFHMHSEELEELQAELKSNHRFFMDPRRTVFYGICSACEQESGGAV
ncbi:MAG: transcriptional repressor [Solobacterium sp.]|nr:transcriptional repressor [Solobacterium sp.]